MALLPSEVRPLPHSPLRQAPLLPYALSLIAGIAVAWQWRAAAAGILWLSATGMGAILSLALYLHSRQRKSPCGLLRVIGLSTIGLAGATLAQTAYESTVTDWPEGNRLWQMEVREAHKFTDTGTSINAKLINAPPGLFARQVRMRLQGERSKGLQPGDIIAFKGKIGRAWQAGNPGDFDYQTYLTAHGISGTAYAADSSWTWLRSQHSSGIGIRLLRLRKQLTEQYARHLQGEQLGILSALTLGDKSLLDTDTRRIFSDTGTSHILALSGLHLGILFSLLQLTLLRWVKRRPLYIAVHVAALAALWLFVGLAGAPLSLQRAAWMFTLLQAGTCLRRSWGATLNNLCLAAIILLLASPLSLLDVGFQMSFISVLGIVLMGNYLWQRFSLPVWTEEGMFPPHYVISRTARFRIRIRQAVRFVLRLTYRLLRSVVWPFTTVSLSAQAATAPFVIYYFHSFPLYGLWANFIVIPAAYCLLAGALLFFLIPLSAIQEAVARLLSGVLHFMTAGIDSISRWPCASLSLYPTLPTLIGGAVLPCLAYAFFCHRLRKRRLRLITASVLLIGICAACEIYRLRPSRIEPQIIVYYTPRSTTLHFISSAARSYLYSTAGPDSTWTQLQYVERNFWNPLHMSRPQLLTARDGGYPELVKRGCLFQFGKKRVYLLCRNLSHAPSGQPPVSVDLLVIGRGCSDNLQTARRAFDARQVVLDGTLSPYYRQRWTTECHMAGLPCHDVRTQGAYMRTIENNKP